MIYGTERTKAERVKEILADRKIAFPLLLDPKSAYYEATDIPVYPTAALLDREGRVAWEGQVYWRKQFADACEKQIKALLEGPEKR